ncbi:MAG TPA: hypothetical protein VK680_09895 [Solirubrobacteraceae bacterium]|nr:hypothetical protein [Solirubrobacteraceae bacterium]
MAEKQIEAAIPLLRPIATQPIAVAREFNLAVRSKRESDRT